MKPDCFYPDGGNVKGTRDPFDGSPVTSAVRWPIEPVASTAASSAHV